VEEKVMRKASLWLLGGFVLAAVAVFVAGHVAQAQEIILPEPILPECSLRSMQPGFPLGGPALLEVTVPPQALGGYVDLYATIGPETLYVQTFPIDAPIFPIAAPVPSDPALLGQLMTFTAHVFSHDGLLLAEMETARDPIVEPDS
jgi:hypothetical protein